MRQGFSLVELSIVIAIIALLVGGIMGGQSLVRAAELRAVTAEYSSYTNAVKAFRDTYYVLPGDYRDATSQWGLQVSGSGCTSNSGLSAATTPGACDGNGDGIINNAAAASQASEAMQFWRHLSLAGMIEGSYSGMAGSGGVHHSLQGINTPASKLSRAGWSVLHLTSVSAHYWSYPVIDYTNLLFLGGEANNTVNYDHNILSPEEAWNIDSKMDDGKPATGKVLAFRVGTCTDAGADNSDFDANYLITGDKVCALLFKGAFQ